jgi:hypothetical protein
MMKVINNRHTICKVFALLAFIVSSCAPAYLPNVVNSPMFGNKGEFQFSTHSSLSGFDPQLAYAITDHLGVMTNASFADRTSDSTDNFHKHKFVEFGAGYYEKIGTKGRFEAFGGFGFGKLKAYYDNSFWQDFASVRNFRFFVQPAIGLSSQVFDGSFATRLVLVRILQGTNLSTGFFVEPVITAKVGFKYVKFVTQCGFSVPFKETELDFEYEPFIFSVGIQATIGRK